MFAALLAVLTATSTAGAAFARPAVLVTNYYTDPASVACATLATYGEARGFSALGKAVVVTSILNRSNKYHQSICAVVFDKQQFSGINRLVFPKAVADQLALKECEDVAALILSGNYTVPPPLSHATYFKTITPLHRWRGLVYLGTAGNHDFFVSK